jgi:hypothetical protein
VYPWQLRRGVKSPGGSWGALREWIGQKEAALFRRHPWISSSLTVDRSRESLISRCVRLLIVSGESGTRESQDCRHEKTSKMMHGVERRKH